MYPYWFFEQIYNRGLSPLPPSTLLIDWPVFVNDDDGEQRYLLYLYKLPEINGRDGCHIEQQHLDPLKNLRERKQDKVKTKPNISNV